MPITQAKYIWQNGKLLIGIMGALAIMDWRLAAIAFTVLAVITLALGIGATTAIFSVVYAVFEPMPYPNSEQLVMVWSWGRGSRSSVPAGRPVASTSRSTSST